MAKEKKKKKDLVKAVVFPAVIYGCESWTVKKAEEFMLLNCDVGEDSCAWGLLRRPELEALQQSTLRIGSGNVET